MNPKPIQELLLGTESNATILGGGWHNVPSSFDLHCRKVWQREKIATWQLHASSHGGPLTQVENFKHRDLKNMTQYLRSGILKNVRGYLHDTGMTFILERLHCEHFFPAQVIPLF